MYIVSSSVSLDLFSELATAANQSNSQDGTIFTLLVNAEDLSMSCPPLYPFGTKWFLDENRKYGIHYSFSIMFMIIHNNFLILILCDILNDFQVPSNSVESLMP